MSDHERGAYTPPTDGGLAFDPRQPVRGARPAPLALVMSILVLAGVVAMIFVFYRSGARQAGQAPETVGTPVASLKTAPPAEAQPDDPAAGLQIYRSEEGGKVETMPPKFTPPPEEPAPRAAPAAPVAAATLPPAAPQPALKPAIPPSAPPAQAAAIPPKAPAPQPVTRLAAATPPPEKTKPATPAPSAALKQAAAPTPDMTKVAAATPKPAPAATPAKPAPAKAGAAAVQIGAVGSTALADKAWSDAVAAAPGLAAGKGKSVEKIEKDGATLYRTAVTGFATRDDAVAFCAKLKAAGKSCFVR